MRIWTVWVKEEDGSLSCVSASNIEELAYDEETLWFKHGPTKVIPVNLDRSAVEQLFAERAVEGKVGEE